jgi:hypothetical protein
MSTFPSRLMTSMVSLWLAQGAAVQAGAIGPMIMGGVSIIGYAFTFAEFLPYAVAHGTFCFAFDSD